LSTPDLSVCPTINYEMMVTNFQKKYGHFFPETGVATLDVPEAVFKLRMDLIVEEFKEAVTALEQRDIVEFADGAADLIYVLIGACNAFGIPINRIFREVHNSNMTKTVSTVREGMKYGTKTPKGPDYVPPNIRGILFHPHRQTLLEEKNENQVETLVSALVEARKAAGFETRPREAVKRWVDEALRKVGHL
jgi:phosphoribosyl-ATP pyrophosphohydrolase